MSYFTTDLTVLTILAEKYRPRTYLTHAENFEVSIPGADQKDRGSEDENDVNLLRSECAVQRKFQETFIFIFLFLYF